MAKDKKKAKKKGKAQKKVKKKGDKVKKPSEKSIFRSRVAELEQSLSSTRAELEQSESTLARLQRQLSAERESRESCLRHLLKVLSGTKGRTESVREQLQFVQDMGELDERRMAEMSRNLERNRDVGKCLFLQEQSQLEEQLSRLEDKRLERSSQLSRLKQLEETHLAQASSETERRRQADMDSVSHVLNRRDAFVGLLEGLVQESQDAFHRSLPVKAKQRLEENVRLRSELLETSGEVLALQDRVRRLKKLQQSAEVEIETQGSADSDVQSRGASLENRLRVVEEENTSLLEKVSGLDPKTLDQLRTDLKKTLSEIARVEDDLQSNDDIREDQVRHQSFIEDRIREQRDDNGLRISVLLKAGEIVKTRMNATHTNGPDVDLLRQLAMVLEEEEEPLP